MCGKPFAVSWRSLSSLLLAIVGVLALPGGVFAGEADLIIPDLSKQVIAFGMTGYTLLLIGVVVSILGLGFGLWIYSQLKALPVHRSMLEISDLIYETCKTYLVTQG
ncbi:MAG: sodium-translocating pyrophosphatase, partial [Planctomycetota bacterium]